MPKVQRIVANAGGARSSGLLVRATPVEFSSGLALSDLGEGIQDFGAGLNNVSESVARIEEKKRLDSENKWLIDTASHLRNSMTDWQSKPENFTSEDYATQFREFSGREMSKAADLAPSGRALTALRSRMLPYIDSQYSGALVTQEKTRLEGTRQSILETIAVSLGNYRKSLSIPNSTPLDDLNSSMAEVEGTIEDTFGKIAPRTASRLRALMDAETALGIFEEFPDQAEKIVRDSTNLQEDEKQTLFNKMGTMRKVVDSQKVAALSAMRKDNLANAAAGEVVAKIPLERYKESYASETSAVLAKQEDDLEIDAWTEAYGHITMAQDKNARAIDQKLSSLRSDTMGGGEKAARVYDRASQALNASKKLQEEDEVMWLQTYNDEVGFQARSLAASTDPSIRLFQATQLNKELLKFQGPAPRDAEGNLTVSEEDAAKYLDRATGDRHLLSRPTAEQEAMRLNRSKPSEFLAQMRSFMNNLYPDPEHQAIVFKDLSTLVPQGQALKQSHQLVWQNRDQWWVDTLVSAFQNPAAIDNLNTETRSTFKAAVQQHPTWIKLQHSLIGPNQHRKELLSGFLDGITTFSASLYGNQRGGDVDASVSKALSLAVDSTMAFANVNGQDVVFDRIKPDGTSYTDDEILDLSRRLEVSLSWIDPRQVDQTSFVNVHGVHPEEQNINRLQALRDDITQNAYWEVEADGQHLSLYIKDDTGTGFQIRTKDKQAFVINLTDLPEFKLPVRTDPRTIPGFHSHTAMQPELDAIKIQPKDRYPIVEQRQQLKGLLRFRSPMEITESMSKGPLGFLGDTLQMKNAPMEFLPTQTTTRTNFPMVAPWILNPIQPFDPQLDLNLRTQ